LPTPRSPRRRALPAIRRSIILTLAAVVVMIAFVAVPATPVRAAVTAPQAESMLLGWINEARADRGLVPLVRWSALAAVAGRRADWMATTNTMSHAGAGSITTQLQGEGVTWYGYGETIGYTSGGWTVDAARSLFSGWRSSAPHWDLLMSDSFNYVGVALAYRSEGSRTFGSIVLTDSVDHTGARGWIASKSRVGDDLRWTWSGADRQLQTRTAGLRDFDVQVRIDRGDWRTIRNDTTSTFLTLRDRARGRAYSVRIRATDRRGTVGAWTNASRIWVP